LILEGSLESQYDTGARRRLRNAAHVKAMAARLAARRSPQVWPRLPSFLGGKRRTRLDPFTQVFPR